MPFLRRRGVMASESDMRRHTSFFNIPKQSRPTSPMPIGSDPDAAVDPPSSAGGLSVSAASASADTANSISNAPPSIPPLPAIGAIIESARSSIDATFFFSPSARPITPVNGNHSNIDLAPDRPQSPPIQEQTPRHRRFSIMRFRNASDSQLASRARQLAQAEDVPPVPRPPEIITTAPTFDVNNSAASRPPIPPIPHIPQRKQSRLKLAARTRKSTDLPRNNNDEEDLGSSSTSFRSWPKRDRRKSMGAAAANGKHPVVSFDESSLNHHGNHPPPEYGDEAASALALPANRLSESSRSDGSSGDRLYGSTTTTTHTVHTTTTFFRLPRRRKNANPPPLFPISHLPQKGRPITPLEPPRESTSSLGGDGAQDSSVPRISMSSGTSGGLHADGQVTPTQSRPVSRTRAGLTTPLGPGPSPARALFQLGNPSPATAFFRPSSRNSGQSSPTRSAPGTSSHLRGRSSTMSSLGRSSGEERPPLTVRSSSSTTGRKSFGDLLGLSRLRQNSEPLGGGAGGGGTLTPLTPLSNTSKNNSLQLPRDSIVLPERRDDDTPVKYLSRLEEVVSRSVIASALSKSTDSFSQAVLRSYMRSFKFFGDPMDMAIRKLLMEAELPRETQQIDRCLQAFANRYDECNPGIYSSPDQAYFIAFSLLILHTDVFNKNNKHKMQKQDYLKNTRDEGISDEILEVFYDNITYTPFIHVEDDFDINGERIVAHKAKRKSIFPGASPDVARKSTKEPIDPYTLIIDDKLDILRPDLRDIMQEDDPYSYLGTATALNMNELQKTFFRTGVLQIVSARSRPDAFMSEKTATNPEEAHPGIVDIKITKVGLLWRKDAKKKKTRSPWQEWGAILTGAQLYFFRNTAWVKSLIHQYETHMRHGQDGIPIIFKPPLEEFKPDALMSTDGAVALLDSSYKKHKHAFTYVRHGGNEEVLLADDEDEMNDWLAKLNYAAAFRTSGVRMRGVVGGLYEGQNRRALRQLGSEDSQSVQTPNGEVMITRSRIDQKMAHDILAARRDIMLQKVADANEKLEQQGKTLEVQLRNARHVQILSPIQPKTREQLFLSAARMANQLKWTRLEIWRLKCHRDILEMDLEDERKMIGLGPEHALESGAAFTGMVGAASAAAGMPADTSTSSLKSEQLQSQQSSLTREESKTSSANTALRRSPRSITHRGSLASGSIDSTGAVAAALASPESPGSDVFQTPPTSAISIAFSQHHKRRNSSDVTSMGLDGLSLRKGSVSSVVSSSAHSITATPPRPIRSSGSGLDKPAPPFQIPPTAVAATAATAEDANAATGDHKRDANEVDAEEQDLLQKTGLLESAPIRATSLGKTPVVEDGGAPLSTEKHHHHHHHHTHPQQQSQQQQQQQESQSAQQSPAQSDKNKIRRSLQRTLREGAGHLSHHRSRRTRDTSVPGAADEKSEQPGVLERGTGSFVVHGKKASVINFGGDFKSIVPSDERLRRRQSLQQGTAGGSDEEGGVLLSEGDNDAGAVGDENSMPTTVGGGHDFEADVRQHERNRERRESATSASTATARSFRQLHRKYSSVRAASKSSGARVGVISDDDGSEAATSVSDGKHAPPALGSTAETGKKLPEAVGEESTEESTEASTETSTEDGTEADEEAIEDGGDGGTESDTESLAASEGAQAQFFTPDPPATPRVLTPDGERHDGSGNPVLPSGTLQAVHA